MTYTEEEIKIILSALDLCTISVQEQRDGRASNSDDNFRSLLLELNSVKKLLKKENKS